MSEDPGTKLFMERANAERDAAERQREAEEYLPLPPKLFEVAERVEERFVVFGRTNTPWAWTALEKAIRNLMWLVRGEQPSEGEET